MLGHYDVRDGVLEVDFTPAEGDKLRLTYGARYLAPPFGAVRVDVPQQDHELIVLYACGKATVRLEGQDANLQRFPSMGDTGKRDDNPMSDIANRYFNAYNQKIKEKRERPRFYRRVRS